MRSLWLEHGITGWDRNFARQTFSFDQYQNHRETVCVMWDFDNLTNYKQSEIQQIARRYLRPSPDIKQQQESFVSNSFCRTMLGVHIRAANEIQIAQKASSKPVIQGTVQKLLDTRAFEGIFLSTDHLPTQQWFQKAFPGTVIREKPFPDDGSPLHLTDFGQPRYEQTQDALVDMMLLASCQAIVHPGSSSFSLCATYFSNLSDKSLIALQSKRSIGKKITNTLSSLIQKKDNHGS
jgi:hypothetical protein